MDDSDSQPAPPPRFGTLGHARLRPPTALESTLDPPAGPGGRPARPALDPCATLELQPGGAPRAVVKPPQRPRLGRYLLGSELGRGGMGRVVDAYDPELRREVAIKVVLETRAGSRGDLERFAAEAQITSQLEHPSIVPVHDCGVTDDGGLFYVMKKVTHPSLRDLLARLAEARPGTARAPVGPDARGEAAWSLPRLLAAFVKVCEAVAYAHSRGVLHRDLKPANIMVGDFGEVLVLDWGIARLLYNLDAHTQAIERLTLDETLTGSVIGTPGYMSPEQLSGDVEALDERSDVWSLGAILYELLTLEPAYHFTSVLECLQVVSAGPPDDPRRRAPWAEIPHELAALSQRALEPDPARRLPSAQALAAEVTAFLEGSRRRARALEVVREAQPIESEAAAARERAAALWHEAAERLRDVPRHAPAQVKVAAWALEDEAEQLEERAKEAEVRFRLTLQNALNLAPDLHEPHRLLAAHYRRHHAAAETAGQLPEAAAWEALLRHHDRGEHARYLAGKGAFSLVTEPAGAEVELLRYEVHERRLVPRSLGSLGRAPLREVELERGRYLLVLRAPGCVEVRYPLHVRRGACEDGVPPGERASFPIELPARGELDADDIYVPAGWFEAGGDPDAPRCFPRRRYWLEAFVMRRHPVTNAEYIRFLDGLVDAAREHEALACVPRERAASAGALGQMVYGRDADGHFGLRADAEGDEWHPRWPVMMVRWASAMRYATWVGQRDGHAWRLPHELEWEKAARGVDGRIFPWGDFLDPSWLCMGESHEGRPVPTPVDDFPMDESPYGVRGLAGNMVDWCLNAFDLDPPAEERPPLRPWTTEHDANDPEVHIALRGAAWDFPPRPCRSARRAFTTSVNSDSYVGFRLVRPLRT